MNITKYSISATRKAKFEPRDIVKLDEFIGQETGVTVTKLGGCTGMIVLSIVHNLCPGEAPDTVMKQLDKELENAVALLADIHKARIQAKMAEL